jgi:hypothetical protein
VDNNQKAERVTLSHGPLQVMKKDKQNGFWNLLTGEELCFYFEYPHDSA